MQRTKIGTSSWDPIARVLTRGQRRIRLTGLEEKLLGHLLANRGRPVTHEALLDQVWRYSARVETRATASTVARLRRKLGNDRKYLKTIYGVGYCLERCGDSGALVGRHGDLRRLRDLLDARALAVVFGFGGVGKTRLVRALAASFGAVVWLDARQLQTPDELFDALSVALSPHGSTVDAALRTMPEPLLVLDAADRLQAASWQAALTLCSELPLLRVVLTSRVPLGDLPALRLDPLGLREASQLFRDTAGVSDPSILDDDEVARIVEGVGCLPGSIRDVATRAGLAGGAALASDPDELAATSDAVFGAGWDALTDDERAVLAAASCFPGEVRVDVLHRVSALRTERLSVAIRSLSRAGMLGGTVPTLLVPPAVRRFVRARVTPRERRSFVAWAARAAAERAGSDTDPWWTGVFRSALAWATGADHRAALALAGARGGCAAARTALDGLSLDGLQPELAADVGLLRSEQALRDGAWADAERWARQAHVHAAAGGSPRRVLDSRLVLCEARRGVGWAGVVADVDQLLTDLREGEASEASRVRGLALGAACAVGTGRPEQAMQLSCRGLARLPDGPSPERMALLVAIAGACRLDCRPDLANRTMEEVLRLADALRERVPLVVLQPVADLARALGQPAWFESLVEARDPGASPAVRHQVARWRALIEPDPLMAELRLRELLERARISGHLDDAALAALHLGALGLARGDLPDARRHLDWASEQLRRRGSSLLATTAAAWHALALAGCEHPTAGRARLEGVVTTNPLEERLLEMVRNALRGVTGPARDLRQDRLLTDTAALIGTSMPAEGDAVGLLECG